MSFWSKSAIVLVGVLAFILVNELLIQISLEDLELNKDNAQNHRLLTQAQVVQYCGSINQIRKTNFAGANRDYQNQIFELVENNKPRHSLTLIELTSQENPDFEGWVKSYLHYSAAWIAFGTIAFLALILFSIFGACHHFKKCHKYRYEKCWCCYKSPSQKWKKLLTIGLLTIATGVLATSIAGYVMIDRVGSGFDDTSCSAVIAMNMINYGNPNLSWAGLSPLATNMQAAFPYIAEASNYTEIGFGHNTTLIAANTSFVTHLDTLYNTWKSTQVVSPNPWQATSITPDILSAWGPPTDSTTETGKIFSEMVTRVNTVDYANAEVSEAAWNLGNYSDIVIYESSVTIGNLLNASRSVQISQDQIVDALNYVPPNIFRVSGFIIFSITLIIALLSAAAIYTFRRKKSTALLNITWILMFSMSVICFSLGAIYFFATILSVEGCRFIEYVRANSSAFESLPKIQNYPWVKNFKNCLYEKTTVDAAFNISGSVSDIVTIINGITNVSAYIQKTYPQSETVLSIKSHVVSAEQGLSYVYSKESNDHNPSIAIDNFNKWASYLFLGSYQLQTGVCSVSQDEWRFHKTNCTAPVETDFASSLSTKRCFSIISSEYADVETRYTDSTFSSCQKGTNSETINVILEGYFNSTKHHINDVQTKFSSLDTSLTTFLAGAVDPINLEVENLVVPLGTLQTNLAELIDAFNNSKTGILSTSNCSFIQFLADDFEDNFCLGFAVPAFSAALIFVISGFFLFIGGVFAFMLRRKLNVYEKQETTTIAYGKQETTTIPEEGRIHLPLGTSSLSPISITPTPTNFPTLGNETIPLKN